MGAGVASDRNVIVGIQHIRGLAAAIVAVYHSSRLIWPGKGGEAGMQLLAAGDFGLQLFFVISGFIITIICLSPSGAPRLSLAEFLRRRFVRIVPMMWIAIATYTVLKLSAGGGTDWLATLRAAVLWPVGELKPGIIWTLRLEFSFYILFALAVMVSRQRLWLIGAWACLPIVTRLAAPYLPWLTPEPGSDSFVWVHLMGHQVGANLQFGMGMLLGLLWNSRHPLFAPRFQAGFLALLAICLVAMVADEGLLRTGIPDLAKILIQTAAVTVIVMIALVLRPRNSAQDRFGKLLGDASYSIYLFHALVQPVIAKALLAAAVIVALPSSVSFMIVTVLSIGVGILIYLFVERPLLRLLGTRVGHSGAPRNAPVTT